MKSSSDAIDLVYKTLQGTALESSISGELWKGKRPQNSSLEDVVINALPVNNTKIQRGLVNVNIHVPNLELDGNPKDTSLPNTARLKELSAIAIGLLKENWGTSGDTLLEVETERVFPDSGGLNHYSNIRVLYYSLQN